MLVTKGYGLSVNDIDWSSPADMKPYLKAYKEELKERDYMAWLQGQYFVSALDCTVCNSELWRRKGEKPHVYIEKPLMQMVERNMQLTEEEKQREVDLFFARENARRLNWRRNRNPEKLNHKEE